MGFDILPSDSRASWKKDLADHGLTVDAYAAIEYLCRLKITSPQIGYDIDGQRFGSPGSHQNLREFNAARVEPPMLVRKIREGIRFEERRRRGWALGLDGILVHELDERIRLVDEYNARIADDPSQGRELRRELTARVKVGGRRPNRLLRNLEDQRVEIQEQGFEYFSLHLAIGEYLFTPYFQILEAERHFKNQIHVFLSKRFKHDHARLQHLSPFFETEQVRNRLKGKAGELLEKKAEQAEPVGRPPIAFYRHLAEEAVQKLRERRPSGYE